MLLRSFRVLVVILSCWVAPARANDYSRLGAVASAGSAEYARIRDELLLDMAVEWDIPFATRCACPAIFAQPILRLFGVPDDAESPRAATPLGRKSRSRRMEDGKARRRWCLRGHLAHGKNARRSTDLRRAIERDDR